MIWGEYVDDQERSSYSFNGGRLFNEKIFEGDRRYGFRLHEITGTVMSADLPEALNPTRVGVRLQGQEVGYWGDWQPESGEVTWTYHPAVREYPP